MPRVEDKNSHMRMFHISSIDDLIANSMDILEPAPVDADGIEREDGILLFIMLCICAYFVLYKYTQKKSKRKWIWHI